MTIMLHVLSKHKDITTRLLRRWLAGLTARSPGRDRMRLFLLALVVGAGLLQLTIASSES